MDQVLAALRNANTALSRIMTRVTLQLHTTRRAQTIAVATVVAFAAVMLVTAMSGARNARQAWGATARVVVATRVLEPGETLNGDNTKVVDAPVGLVADDALNDVPAGATVRIGLDINSMITASMTSGGEKTVGVPDGWRVVAMAPDVAAPELSPGDIVDVVSTDSVLASGAIVITAATNSQGPSIAVPQEVAAVVATAAREGTASVVLAG